MHLFRLIEFKIGAESIESIEHPGIATDIMYHTLGTEFKQDDGSLNTFIPDSSLSADINLVNTPSFLAGGVGDAAGIVNSISNKSLKASNTFNSGFYKRLSTYNYTVPNAATLRDIECFIPLNAIFGFCDCYDRLLKFIGFDIILHRFATTDVHKAIYGTANTSILFGNEGDVTGLKSVVLEIDTYFPTPLIASEMDKIYQKGPIEIAYLQREGRVLSMGAEASYDFTQSKKSIPRVCFAVFHGKTGVASQLSFTTNYQIFRNIDLKYIQCDVDGQLYPNIQQLGEFKKNCLSRFYQDFLQVSRKLGGDGSISMKDFKELYPIFAIDLSNQKEKLTNQPINFRVSIARNEVPVNDDTHTEPMTVEGYLLTLNEVRYSVDVINQIIRKLN